MSLSGRVAANEEAAMSEFEGGDLIEQPDGSARLIVRTAGQTVEIHLARHVYEDLGFLFYQRYHNARLGRPRERLDDEL
jgi:hypothetical protein